ncbi:MAG: nickel-dependent hydrogenase large subunit [Bilophila sp.]
MNTLPEASSFSLPIGPVHVALEEPIYFRLDISGETVRGVEITSGHVHRGMEGMATQRNLFKNTTLVERVCSLCSNSHSLTYCMVVENVLNMLPPLRAQYLRILAEETKRVASHLFNVAIFAHNVGFKSLFLHVMEVREDIQDVKETIYGNRMNLAANCIGGVKFDMNNDLAGYMREKLNKVEAAVRHVERVFSTDPMIAKRARGVGILPKEEARRFGVVGPVARGSGLEIDVRRNTPYLVYPEMKFDLITEPDGDVLSRALVRVREIFESIGILRQCLNELPAGEVKVRLESIPNSEAVARSEAPRGELFYFIRTNGTDTPARLKWRVPSYMNWEALTVMMKDCQLADIPLIVNSIDPCVSCTER